MVGGCPSELRVINIKTYRSDYVEGNSCSNTCAHDVACILGNLRFEKNYIYQFVCGLTHSDLRLGCGSLALFLYLGLGLFRNYKRYEIGLCGSLCNVQHVIAQTLKVREHLRIDNAGIA